MRAEDDWLRQMVERASTLAERLSEPCVARPEASAATLQARWVRWRHLAAADDDAAFAQRLALGGLTRERAQRALSPGHWRAPQALPPWALLLQEGVMQSAKAAHQPLRTPGPGALPFEDVLVPLVAVAESRVQHQAGAHAQGLNSTARAALSRSLLVRLCGLCAETLFVAFTVRRSVRRVSGLPTTLPVLAGDAARTHYTAFVASLRGHGLAEFFAIYPVLGRLVGQLCQAWIERTLELLARLHADMPALSALFGDGADLGCVSDIHADLSDFHHHGRAVCVLRFSRGIKVVYKPRALAVDIAYAQFLAWINQRTRSPLRILRVLNRGAYGWVEYVHPAPCADHAALARYYHRAGMLLALTHLLESTDLHYENLVAAGEQPVLIDLETLCQHRRRDFEESELTGARALFETVIRTQLLPRWERGPDGRVFDISGLAGTGAQEAGFQVPVWRAVNTDAMERTVERGRTASQKNLPTLCGQTVNPGDHVDAVVDGFVELSQLFLHEQAALLAPDGPLAGFAGCPVRFIARATEHYALLQSGALHPRNLRDGVDFSLHFETLWSPLTLEPRARELAPLVEDEICALTRLDIPRFTAYPDRGVLCLSSGGQIDGHLVGPSLDTIRARVRAGGEEEWQRQVAYIRASMYTRFAVGDHARPALAPAVVPPSEAPPTAVLSAPVLLEAARRIAHDLAQRAIRSRHGSVSFLMISGLPGMPQQLHPIGESLYDGLGGVALFLSAVARLTHDEQARELALASLAAIRAALAQPHPQRLIRALGIGGCLGWGSIIYALVRCGTLLEQTELLDDAERCVALLDERIVADDDKLDVVSGAAGLLLALLALHRLRPADDILALAHACGEHVLQKRLQSTSGLRAFPTVEGRLLTGFSHGASGIAYALGCLACTTGEPHFAAAAREALGYEASLYTPAVGNWPDLRVSDARYGISWCHGAPGIALARLGLLTTTATTALRTELADAMATTMALPAGPVDTVCCGTLGRVEVLLTAGLRLGHEAWVQQAYALTAHFLQRVAAGDLRWAVTGGLYAPGFFQGASGVGYQLLRLACPQALPSVLLLE